MKKLQEDCKKPNGITLVALVITVVVMLILAGVAIAVVVDGEGLFNKTRQATETYENAVRDEADLIQSLKNEIDEHIGDNLVDGNPPAEPIENPLKTIVNVNQTYDGGTKGTFSNPIIPKGFAPINENGATWGSDDGYKYGLVITDEVTGGESTGNEFVWVPVDGTTVKFGRHEFGTKYQKVSECTEIVPTEIIKSVTNNGGFYIARYEAGIAANMPQEELSSNSSATYGDGTYKPVSKQGVVVWNYIQYGDNNNETTPGNGAVTIAKSMYREKNTDYGVASTLIYGAQWDTTLRFIGAYNTEEAGYDIYATNSIGMGNYNGTNLGDTTTSGPATCGLLDAFRQKNIYDMAGNVWEWTMEAYSTGRIFRGGNYKNSGSDLPASSRGSSNVNFGYPDLGFRVALYIKQKAEN